MKLTAKQKQQLVDLLDWYFDTLTPVKATAVSENAAQYQGAPDTEAPVSFGGQNAPPRQHSDASVNKPIPELAGFVPSAQANGVPSGKTDTNQVKRI